MCFVNLSIARLPVRHAGGGDTCRQSRTARALGVGAIPSPELVARVGTLLADLAKAGALLGAEGLRASSVDLRELE
jgi:hypothetical protein